MAVIANNESQLEITMVYRIKNAVQLQRDDITPEQAGIKVSKVGETNIGYLNLVKLLHWTK
ncbi:hypothetical protein O9853_12440 [Vibrio lentus]|nr:hypothetical protein [Vibrio lentus]